mmetsp:Transcript_18466/g.30779  ORF Transcript_18466/g.30779 Transcript_18466/m.30779 type:complete len:180 (-) Transcript_18466:88-627(-)
MSDQEQIETTDMTEKQHRECLRRTVRSFIQHWGEVDYRPISPCNLFVAVRPYNSISSQISDVLENTKCFNHRSLSTRGVASKLKKRSPHPQQHEFVCKNHANVDHQSNACPSEIISNSSHGIISPTSTSSEKIHSTNSNRKAIGGVRDKDDASIKSGSSARGETCTWLILKKGIKGVKI